MRRLLCIVLAFIICSFSIFTYIYAEDSEETKLQDEQKKLQEQINEKSDELENVQSELSQNLQQIDKLDEKIEKAQQELDELNIEIAKLQTSMDEIKAKLDVAEANFKKQKTLLDNRLIAVYESSDTQYLDVILSSKSVSEFLSNYFLITELATRDSELLEEMQTKKEIIEKSKEEIDYKQNNLSIIKANQTKTAKILENTKIVRQNFIEKLSEEEKSLQTQIDEYNSRFNEINREILAQALEGIDTKYIGGELAWPVPGYTRISSKYGMRFHPILHYTKLHTGVDISAPMGADFIAANDGIVTKAQFNTAYGNMVIIDHGGGVSTLYAHGSEILVEVGQTVKRGEPVLKVGSTGYSTGAHAHFEVRLNGVVTDPMPYITNGLIPDASKKDETENKTNEQNDTQNTNTQN